MLSLRAVELLCSRLCHDLVSPIGAINNGVELIQEMGLSDPDDEALALIAGSGQTAARRLALFRMALGAAGGDGTLTNATTRDLAQGWLAESRTRLDWRLGDPPEAPRGLWKLVLMAVVLAEEGMPRGGILTLTPAGPGVTVAGSGPGAGLREEVRVALLDRVAEQDLSARTVWPHVAVRLADGHGLAIRLEPARPDSLCLHLSPA